MKRAASLGVRLAWLYSLAAAGVFALAGALIEASVEQHFVEQDMEVMEGKLALARGTLGALRTRTELAALPVRIEEALIGYHGLELQIAKASGAVLFSTISPPASLSGLPLAQGPIVPHKIAVGGVEMRGFSVAVPTAIAGEPPLILSLAVDIEHHEHFLRSFRRSLALVVGAAILLVALLSVLITRRSLKPLRDLAHLASQISASRLAERLRVEKLPRELDELADAFNAMLERLEASFVRLSEFSSDLAHELRTPIANLTTQTQVLLTRERSPDEYREVLFSNLEEFERLSRMVSDMLYIAKADNGLLLPRREELALAAEADALLEYFEALATEKGLKLVRIGEARLLADPLMIRRALANLLANAIRHADPDSRVELELAEHGDAVSIRLRNRGETIAPEHLPRLFDRFYRVDPARVRVSDGAGLGLAITRSIVEAHGGQIAVRSAERMTEFEIRLPGANARPV
ncbi:heavy metal sensor histidine kinase [Niveibacterium terrae]|uniref:heavy metal sensor histidine kinase n=1 Tax=Niveibacterium terrae TaxID=3373598 RepID=UPI003A8EF19B